MTKVDDLVEALQKRDSDKKKNTILWVFAVIGVVAAVAAVAYAVYRYFAPDYMDDFDDDFDDDFEDFFDEDDFPDMKGEAADGAAKPEKEAGEAPEAAAEAEAE